jgi:hypothetical protein
MLIDCERCEVQGLACGDCVVTVLLGQMPEVPKRVELDADERAAIDVLAVSGLVPPLRLVLPDEPHGTPTDGHKDHTGQVERASQVSVKCDNDSAAIRQRAAG